MTSKHKEFADDLIMQAIYNDVFEERLKAEAEAEKYALTKRERELSKRLESRRKFEAAGEQIGQAIAAVFMGIVVVGFIFGAMSTIPIWLLLFGGVAALPILVWVAIIALGVHIGSPRK